MRLIDADALMKSIGCEDATKYGNKTAEQQHNSYSTMMMYEIANAIDDAPTIEAEPVRHGTWEEIETCAFVGFDGNGSPKERRQKYYRHICGRCSAIKEKFCPNCGVKMDGGAGCGTA